MPINAHDAEERLRPVLGLLHDAREEAERLHPTPAEGINAITRLMAAQETALDEALALLGVQR